MTNNIEFHPIASMFPMMSKTEFEAFTQDIRDNGQREPIVLLDGKALDGRHRLKACNLLGKKVESETFKEKGITPINYVVSKNLHRRHLTPTDKALSAIMYKEMLDKSSKLHPRVPNKNGKLSGVGHNLQEAAKAFVIGINTIQHMLFLRDSRSDLFDKVMARQMSPNTAYRIAKTGDKNGYHVSQARKKSEEYITAENEAIAKVNKLISQGWNFEMRVENGIYKAHFYGQKMEKPLVEWNMGFGFSSFTTALNAAARNATKSVMEKASA